jgi:hypothetical protein
MAFQKINEVQNGILKVNGLIAFYYFFNDLGCKMQSVTDGSVIDEWHIEMKIRD